MNCFPALLIHCIDWVGTALSSMLASNCKIVLTIFQREIPLLQQLDMTHEPYKNQRVLLTHV